MTKIYVAGHHGLVGSAITRRLRARGRGDLLLRTRAELDLEDRAAVQHFFCNERPDFVFMAAAKVGGIQTNWMYPVDFLLRNLRIQNNVIEAAWQNGAKGLLFLGSSCIYPKMAPQPLKEEYLLSGPLEPTNEPYAVAKIAGIELCEAFNRQYGTRFMSVMPTNLYGPGDNYDLETSHVLPALIRKFHLGKLALAGDWDGLFADQSRHGPIPASLKAHLSALASRSRAPLPKEHPAADASWIEAAKTAAEPGIPLWGTGSPRREFLFVDDLADACVFLMERWDAVFDLLEQAPGSQGPARHLINIGYGEDLSIGELARLTAEIVGYDGPVLWDPTKPDGTPRKLLDVSRISAMGWRPQMNLRDGIKTAYESYRR